MERCQKYLVIQSLNLQIVSVCDDTLQKWNKSLRQFEGSRGVYLYRSRSLTGHGGPENDTCRRDAEAIRLHCSWSEDWKAQRVSRLQFTRNGICWWQPKIYNVHQKYRLRDFHHLFIGFHNIPGFHRVTSPYIPVLGYHSAILQLCRKQLIGHGQIRKMRRSTGT